MERVSMEGVSHPNINDSTLPYRGCGGRIDAGPGTRPQGRRGVAARAGANGPFLSSRDFLGRVRLDPSDAMLLVKAGCFDALEGKERRPRLLWELLAAQRRFDQSGSGLLFEEDATLPSPPPYDDRTVLSQEVDALGMLVSCHPLLLHRRAIAAAKLVRANQIGQWVGRYITMIGWWVTGKTVQNKGGRPMEFVTFEDTTANFDATFFPKVYARFCQKLSRHRPYLLKGRVEEEFGVATMNVEWVDFLGN